jgi:hypothetical protein
MKFRTLSLFIPPKFLHFNDYHPEPAISISHHNYISFILMLTSHPLLSVSKDHFSADFPHQDSACIPSIANLSYCINYLNFTTECESLVVSIIFRRLQFQILAWVLAILSEDFCGFPQPHQANSRILPQIRPWSFVPHPFQSSSSHWILHHLTYWIHHDTGFSLYDAALSTELGLRPTCFYTHAFIVIIWKPYINHT